MKYVKSQIFVVDLVFSFVLLIVTVAVLFTYYVDTDQNVDIYQVNVDILDSLSKTRINSLNDQTIRELFQNAATRRNINVENTLAQQIIQFVRLDAVDGEELARNITNVIVNSYVGRELNVNLTLTNGSEVTPLYYVNNAGNPVFKDATISSSNERLIIGFVNRTEYYDNYLLQLRVWI